MDRENTNHTNDRFRTRVSMSLLEDFAQTISKMDRTTLQRLRAECVSQMPVPDPDDVFLEIIDGNFALREIRDLPDLPDSPESPDLPDRFRFGSEQGT